MRMYHCTQHCTQNTLTHASVQLQPLIRTTSTPNPRNSAPAASRPPLLASPSSQRPLARDSASAGAAFFSRPPPALIEEPGVRKSSVTRQMRIAFCARDAAAPRLRKRPLNEPTGFHREK